ncbi:MAG: aspartate aminotransferase family protein [Pseudomonadota bacterium]
MDHPTPDWDQTATLARREKFYAASQRSFMPYREPLIFKQGKGQYLWDDAGQQYTDLLGMNVCISVGHAHPVVTAAVKAQAEELAHCTAMFCHPTPAHLAEELAATMPEGHDWQVHFTNSGAEAIDLALMMTRAATGNVDFLALRSGYHGVTYGAQALTGIAGFRHNQTMVAGVHHIAEPNQYRGIFGPELDPYLDEIDHTLTGATSGKLAGMIIEPLQGYGGIVEMPQGYIKGAAERVRERGGLLVVDEVQSGFARTGSAFWAFETHDVVPDIMVCAKGIGNGYPLAAVVARREIADALEGKFLFHTYGCNPVSCAAGRAVLQVLREEKLQDNAAHVGGALLAALRDLQQKYRVIGDVRGRGLMLAIELVQDRASREPDPDTTTEVFEASRRHGLVLSKSGPHRSVLRMVPPLCLSMSDVDRVASAMDACFAEAI